MIDHPMIHCPIATELWSMVFGLCGVHWVMPKTITDLLPLFFFFFLRNKLVGKGDLGIIAMVLFGWLSPIV